MRRWVVGGVIAVSILVLVTGPAGAITTDLPSWVPNPLECPPGVPVSKTPPTPTTPNGFGFLGGLVAHDPNVTGDPFVPDAKVSILDQYGYGGLEWHTYDLGCGGDLANPLAGLATQFANWQMLVPIAMLQLVGFIGSTFGAAEWIHMFDAIFEQLGRAIAAGPFRVLFPLATMALAIVIVRHSRKQSTADAASDAAWWFAFAVGAVILMVIPTYFARQTDHALDFGMGAVREAFHAGAGPLADVGPIHRDALYSAWLAGNFGSADAPAAQRYGPELFKAQAFSYDELRTINGDPAKYRQAVEAKQKQWMDTAKHVEDEFPDSYVVLQGKDTRPRLIAGFGALLFAAVAALFLLWAGLSFVKARFITRVVIVAAPLCAIVGIFPKHRHRMIGLWNVFTAALVQAVIALFAAGLVSILIGAVLNATGTSQVTKMLACGLISYGAWKVSAPFRKAGMLGTGVWGMAKSVGSTALGVKLGAGSKGEGGGMPPWRDTSPPPPDPQPAPPRNGYDAGHARTRNGTEPGGTYRPTSVPPPLHPGMSAIDAVPTSVGGETVYRTKERSSTSHRRVHHDDPSYRHAGERPDPQPAGYVRPEDLPVREGRTAAPPRAPRSRLRPDAGDASWYDRPDVEG